MLSRILSLALLFGSTFFISSLSAQSTPTSLAFGAQLTNSHGAAGDTLGLSVAIDGDTAVAGQNCAPWFYNNTCDEKLVYVFQRHPGGWSDETQTSDLIPSSGDIYFGGSVGISGDTVVVSGKGRAYVFVKPTAGWRSMTEVAQLLIPVPGAVNFPAPVAISGDTIVVGSKSSAYVFTKPASGWATTSAYDAQLADPREKNLSALAIDGNTVVLGYPQDVYPETGPGHTNVFVKPATGWAANPAPNAKLTSSNAGEYLGSGTAVAVSGNAIAVASDDDWVDMFIEPASGWTDSTEATELMAPAINIDTGDFGTTLAFNDQHLVVGSDQIAFVYAKPAGGWGVHAWPSALYIGNDLSWFADRVGFHAGTGLGISADTFIVGAPFENVNGIGGQGAAYVFTVPQNWIEVSSDFLQFPELGLSNSEVLPLTVTNIGTAAEPLTASLTSSNFKVMQTAENTCNVPVPAGQSCTLPIQFDAPGVGTHTSYLNLSSPTSASVRFIQLRGSVTGIGSKAESLTVGGHVGETYTVQLIVLNIGVPGSPTVTATSSNPAFTVVPGSPCTTSGVATGKYCKFPIQFSPTKEGEIKATITLTPTTGPASTVPITGYAE